MSGLFLQVVKAPLETIVSFLFEYALLPFSLGSLSIFPKVLFLKFTLRSLPCSSFVSTFTKTSSKEYLSLLSDSKVTLLPLSSFLSDKYLNFSAV